jgi:hypothetical protein
MHEVSTRLEFAAAVRRAVERGEGFAAGKIGVTERTWLRYPIVRREEADERRRRAFELVLAFKSLRQAGIFPASPDFYARWAELYVEEVRRLDCIGLVPGAYVESLELLAHHAITGPLLVAANDQQPDRSSPHDPAGCYLDSFRGRDLLLVAPFAEFLCTRANARTFEAVWAKTGKPWFHPRSVQAIEVPYGFSSGTQAKYATSLDVRDELLEEISRREFDVALIAAGGLGIPLAAAIAAAGRVAISLGGHLQIVFGVLGERWRGKESWQRRYFNDAWTDLPARYIPDRRETGENDW